MSAQSDDQALRASRSSIEKSSIHEGSAEFVRKDLKYLDVAVSLAAGHADDPDLSPAEERRLRVKLDWHLLPLLFAIDTVQFVDKSTLASSSILGFIQDNNLSTNQFNTLNSAFYIGYLVFSWPQNWALQYFPVGKWLTFNIFLWCLFLGLHPVCHNFGSFFTLRFLLGATEGCMTTGFMIITSMYYTRTEICERLGWTIQFNGMAVIVASFLSFGAYHADPNGHPNQWQWMIIATTIMTFLIFILFVLFFPDNPTNAYFLTKEEKIKVIRRVKENQNGIETKTWKMYQFFEAVKDVRTWLFFFYVGFGNLVGGVGVEYSLLIKSFGFTTLQTTLLSIPSGTAQMIGVMIGCYALRRFPNARAWIAIASSIPMILCALLQLFVPFSNKAAHLSALYLLYLGSTSGFVMVLSWITSTLSGHTKKTTVNGIVFVGYALGQTLGSQPWKDKYKPRNLLPWGIILGINIIDIIIVLAIRYVLVKENKCRDRLKAEAEASGHSLSDFQEYAYIDTTDTDGNPIRTKVDKYLMDLTDKENLSFRYVL